jgi:FkbM family methyltransferase
MFEVFDRIGVDRETRHRLVQRLLWNRLGEGIVRTFSRVESLFNTVVRNYSIMSPANGEKWLPTLLPSRPFVIDIGFFTGAFTRAVLAERSEARIVGFDPSKQARKAYQHTWSDEPRVDFEHLALSNDTGSATFFDYDNMCNSLSPRRDRGAEPASEYEVDVTTLDQYLNDRALGETVDLLKIDAEGHDVEVLQGASELLRDSGVGIFMFEFGSAWINSGYYLRDVVEFVDDKPYELFRLFNGFLNSFEYKWSMDSCTQRPAMYVGVSHERLESGGIPVRHLEL